MARKTIKRPRQLMSHERPALLYAIGDVHGCIDELHELETEIIADAAGTKGVKWIVMLGDYVDRGPRSAEVLDHLMGPAPFGFTRICLKGNHEATMFAALTSLAGMADWLTFGGETTLESYGMSDIQIAALLDLDEDDRIKLELLSAYIPPEHLAFIRDLPLSFSMPGFVFVHAGLRPGPPLKEQTEQDMLWIRKEFLHTPHDHGGVVIHGHTPMDEPTILPYRINIDTACFMTGKLTALRVDAAGETRLLQTAGWD
ncbi:MAG TPA: metallophosphoesterase family protein [Devosia sp.]|nr:metallophosphoesterase family protein [Devosia sp.]